MNNYALAEKIKSLRVERSWSQLQLSEASRLSLRTIQRVEKYGKCSPETLLSLSSTFEVEIKELTELIDNYRADNDTINIDIPGIHLRSKRVNPSTAIIAGILLAFPAIYFIVASVLKYNFSFPFLFDPLEVLYASKEIAHAWNLIAPVIFIGGLISAFILNLVATLSISIRKVKRPFKINVSFYPNVSNLIVGAVSILSFLIIIGYAITENFVLR